MKISVEDMISEIQEMEEDSVDVIYELYNELIDSNDDAVKLICKLISHFDGHDKKYLDKIKLYISEREKSDRTEW